MNLTAARLFGPSHIAEDWRLIMACFLPRTDTNKDIDPSRTRRAIILDMLWTVAKLFFSPSSNLHISWNPAFINR